MAFVCPYGIRLLQRASITTTIPSKALTCSLHIFLPNPIHTEALGAELAKSPCRGDVILLHGDLGCGKTALARGYIRRIRQNPELDVTSPTYLLDNYYPDESNADGIHVHHMDLWRLKTVTERAPFIDFEKVFTNDVSLVEWPDRLGSKLTPPGRLDVYFKYPDMDNVEIFINGDRDTIQEDDFDARGRYVDIVPHGSSWESRIEELRKRTCVSVRNGGQEQSRILQVG